MAAHDEERDEYHGDRKARQDQEDGRPCHPAEKRAGHLVEVSDRRMLEKNVGRKVVAVGRAEFNYKDGCILVLDDGERLRLGQQVKRGELEAGRRVRMTGTVSYNEIPGPDENPGAMAPDTFNLTLDANRHTSR